MNNVIFALALPNLGLPELLIILVIIMVFFGAGKLPKVLGQMGKGVKAFKDGMKEDENKDILQLEAENEPLEETLEAEEAEEVKKA